MRRLGGFYLLAVAVAALPFIFPDNYFVTVVGVSAGLHAILAVSLNLLMGYAGQISLGHAAFFGMGAYTSAILTTRYGWNPWPTILVGLAFTGVIAYIVARPILKLKGHYLAMATLGLGIIVHIVIVQMGWLTGGPDGLGSIPTLSLFGWTVDTDLRWYAVIGTLLMLVIWLALNLIDSRSGRALRALHGSEVAAEMMGIDTAATKTGVFVLAALIASLAGSVFAHQQAFVSPGSFDFFFSIELVTMVVLGGMASTYGAVLGAIILTFLPELLVVFEDYEVMIFGAILMGMMIFLPQGLFIGFQDLLRKFTHRRAVTKKEESSHGVA
ncbi:MAG: branched-chain amino acid ABC transporter permease [Sedimenticola sp.]|uniref:Branched-chain amino acid ABC transporter permease n=1 Tax=Sedimenticola thiotaurini TaxID=1543721 RepID=A0A558CJC2_9GAMM|nr:branched-chain amino acid ABC transporter permease [Sedimenticola sp.]MDF1527501.1 branched-chain amino acid ABC transporter permease [Sedimenticola sp.]TVT48834.1 MAG: branched-chain amino acid ABC transporter permease [Sedimenticola thiotaurini]